MYPLRHDDLARTAPAVARRALTSRRALGWPRLAGWLLALSLPCCAEHPEPRSGPRQPRTAPAAQALSARPSAVAPAASGGAEALPDDRGTLVDLDVPGFAAAVVAVPAEGSPPHRVVVAAQGNYDRPDWECGWWRRLVPSAFVLCPRGSHRPDSPSEDDARFTYESDRTLEAELEAGERALRDRYGARIGTGSMMWVGLSRGAYLGALIAARRPAQFPDLVLVEGGHDPWTPANAQAFAAGGGRRVLFVCGQGACLKDAHRAGQQLRYQKVEVQIAHVPGMGHGLSGDADAPVMRALPWLLDGAPLAKR